MAETEKAGKANEANKRKILIAIDGSENSGEAFHCESPLTIFLQHY